jgi:DNA-binding transcriptional regulator YhcF (GntR family)
MTKIPPPVPDFRPLSASQQISQWIRDEVRRQKGPPEQGPPPSTRQRNKTISEATFRAAYKRLRPDYPASGHGLVKQLAIDLGVDRRTVQRHLRDYGISRSAG